MNPFRYQNILIIRPAFDLHSKYLNEIIGEKSIVCKKKGRKSYPKI
jgi:hypothetical protein